MSYEHSRATFVADSPQRQRRRLRRISTNATDGKFAVKAYGKHFFFLLITPPKGCAQGYMHEHIYICTHMHT